MQKFLGRILASILLFSSVPAFSKSESVIKGKVVSEFFNNNIFDSNDVKNEYNENYLRSSLYLKANATKNLYFKSKLRFREVYQDSENTRRDQLPQGGGDSSFENEGLYIKNLTLHYDFNQISAQAGKFTANYGKSWKWNSGIWNRDLAKYDYRQDEKLGFSFKTKSGHKRRGGKYIFGLDVFTNDNNKLDNSIITKRDGVSKNEGKPGDKRGLASYVASLDIKMQFGRREKLSYHLAYVNLAINDKWVSYSNKGDQKGFVANLDYHYPISRNIFARGLVEYSFFDNLYGDVDQDANFLVSNLTLYLYRNWNLTLSRSFKAQTQIGANGSDKTTSEISFGYKFDQNSIFGGLQILLGYKEEKVDYKTLLVEDNVFGGLVRYVAQF